MSASNTPLQPAAGDPASTGGGRRAFATPLPANLSAPASSKASPLTQALRDAVLTVVARHRDTEGPLLPVLHDVQRELGCIPPEAVEPIAHALNLSRAEVHGVISFYPHFRTMPAGRHLVEICRGEACQSRGGEHLVEHARRTLGCDFHETTADGEVTLQPVYCLGLCARPPSIMIDGHPYSRVSAEKFDRLIAEVSA